MGIIGIGLYVSRYGITVAPDYAPAGIDDNMVDLLILLRIVEISLIYANSVALTDNTRDAATPLSNTLRDLHAFTTRIEPHADFTQPPLTQSPQDAQS